MLRIQVLLVCMFAVMKDPDGTAQGRLAEGHVQQTCSSMFRDIDIELPEVNMLLSSANCR